MKRNEFRTMVKEIIKEVITEMDDAPPLEKDPTAPVTPDVEPPEDNEPIPTPSPKGLRKHGRMSRVLGKWRDQQIAKVGGLDKNPHSWPNR